MSPDHEFEAPGKFDDPLGRILRFPAASNSQGANLNQSGILLYGFVVPYLDFDPEAENRMESADASPFRA